MATFFPTGANGPNHAERFGLGSGYHRSIEQEAFPGVTMVEPESYGMARQFFKDGSPFPNVIILQQVARRPQLRDAITKRIMPIVYTGRTVPNSVKLVCDIMRDTVAAELGRHVLGNQVSYSNYNMEFSGVRQGVMMRLSYEMANENPEGFNEDVLKKSIMMMQAMYAARFTCCIQLLSMCGTLAEIKMCFDTRDKGYERDPYHPLAGNNALFGAAQKGNLADILASAKSTFTDFSGVSPDIMLVPSGVANNMRITLSTDEKSIANARLASTLLKKTANGQFVSSSGAVPGDTGDSAVDPKTDEIVGFMINDLGMDVATLPQAGRGAYKDRVSHVGASMQRHKTEGQFAPLNVTENYLQTMVKMVQRNLGRPAPPFVDKPGYALGDWVRFSIFECLEINTTVMGFNGEGVGQPNATLLENDFSPYAYHVKLGEITTGTPGAYVSESPLAGLSLLLGCGNTDTNIPRSSLIVGGRMNVSATVQPGSMLGYLYWQEHQLRSLTRGYYQAEAIHRYTDIAVDSLNTVGNPVVAFSGLLQQLARFGAEGVTPGMLVETGRGFEVPKTLGTGMFHKMHDSKARHATKNSTASTLTIANGVREHAVSVILSYMVVYGTDGVVALANGIDKVSDPVKKAPPNDVKALKHILVPLCGLFELLAQNTAGTFRVTGSEEAINSLHATGGVDGPSTNTLVSRARAVVVKSHYRLAPVSAAQGAMIQSDALLRASNKKADAARQASDRQASATERGANATANLAKALHRSVDAADARHKDLVLRLEFRFGTTDKAVKDLAEMVTDGGRDLGEAQQEHMTQLKDLLTSLSTTSKERLDEILANTTLNTGTIAGLHMCLEMLALGEDGGIGEGGIGTVTMPLIYQALGIKPIRMMIVQAIQTVTTGYRRSDDEPESVEYAPAKALINRAADFFRELYEGQVDNGVDTAGDTYRAYVASLDRLAEQDAETEAEDHTVWVGKGEAILKFFKDLDEFSSYRTPRTGRVVSYREFVLRSSATTAEFIADINKLDYMSNTDVMTPLLAIFDGAIDKVVAFVAGLEERTEPQQHELFLRRISGDDTLIGVYHNALGVGDAVRAVHAMDREVADYQARVDGVFNAIRSALIGHSTHQDALMECNLNAFYQVVAALSLKRSVGGSADEKLRFQMYLQEIVTVIQSPAEEEGEEEEEEGEEGGLGGRQLTTAEKAAYDWTVRLDDTGADMSQLRLNGAMVYQGMRTLARSACPDDVVSQAAYVSMLGSCLVRSLDPDANVLSLTTDGMRSTFHLTGLAPPFQADIASMVTMATSSAFVFYSPPLDPVGVLLCSDIRIEQRNDLPHGGTADMNGDCLPAFRSMDRAMLLPDIMVQSLTAGGDPVLSSSFIGWYKDIDKQRLLANCNPEIVKSGKLRNHIPNSWAFIRLIGEDGSNAITLSGGPDSDLLRDISHAHHYILHPAYNRMRGDSNRHLIDPPYLEGVTPMVDNVIQFSADRGSFNERGTTLNPIIPRGTYRFPVIDLNAGGTSVKTVHESFAVFGDRDGPRALYDTFHTSSAAIRTGDRRHALPVGGGMRG